MFLCIGNACRSQMAEGFARAYGSDVIEPCSAGLGPAHSLPPLTLLTMQEKNIDLSQAFPKGVDKVDRQNLDMIVNLTGNPLPVRLSIPVADWEVRDPIGQSEKVYRQVRDEIENRVLGLILDLRAEAKAGGSQAKEESGFSAPGIDIRRNRFRE